MYTDELFAQQKQWAEQGLFRMRSILPLMSPFGTCVHIDKNDRGCLGMLLTATARSTESAFLLMAYGQLWDAETLVRSIFEGSLKFCYIVQKPTEFKARLDEYERQQFEISLVKDDQKARDLLKAVPNPMDFEWKPIKDRVLPEVYREELRAKYSKAHRSTLERKWGYAGLLESLSQSGDLAYGGFTGLAYGYSIASHIQHADYFGISVPYERECRSAERRDAIHMAHLGRLIIDCFVCFQLRLGAALRFANADLAPLSEVVRAIKECSEAMDFPYKKWLAVEYGDDEDITRG